MAHHTLTLNYDPAGFRPDPDPVLVKAGDTISFQLSNAPPGSNFKITMNQPGGFQPAEVTDSNTTITVVEAAITTYTCELSGAAGPIFSSSKGQGGHVRPKST